MNPHFPLPIRGEFITEGKLRFRLTEPFVFLDGDTRILVPAGFVTDFNSTPRLVWSWFPPTEHIEAGIVHDYLYQFPEGLSRKECDQIHMRILELLGVRKTKRVAAYLGLRLGAGLTWRRYRGRDS